MVRVEPRRGETPMQMVKRFKQACVSEGVYREIKRCQYYEKPSEKRRRKKLRAIINARLAKQPIRLPVDNFGD